MELEKLGKKIASARKRKGLSPYELSLRIGKDSSYMYKVEKGQVNLRYTVILDICRELEICPKELF